MRKIIAILLLLALATSNIFAIEDSATLTVRAYKSNVSADVPTALYVTDAITSDANNYHTNLGYLGDDDRSMDLTTSLSDLLGVLTRDPETIVFSYRVESSETGSFAVSIVSDGAFKQTGTNNTIDFEWSLANVTFESVDPGSDVNGNALTAHSISGTETITGNVQTNGAQLINSWVIAEGGSGVWFKRGAVALLIDRTDYENGAYGNYSTNVTVTLTKN